MKALVFHNKGDQSVKTIALPELRPAYLLVKIDSVALNPTDCKHVLFFQGATPFSIIGCDYAGTVVSIGAEVTKPFNIGDKVYGCAHGGNYNQPYDGTFAQYAMVMGDLAMHVPTHLSHGAALGMEDLCAIGLGSITVGQGLFQPGKGLALALPEQGNADGGGEWVLIYGGSTATGTLGIQFAKLAGYRVIATCSARNNMLVKSRGADEVFDYNDPECGPKIRKLTGDHLRYAWDTIGQVASAKICDEALSSNSAICHYGTILGNKFPREDVKNTSTLMYTVFGEAFYKYQTEFPALRDDFEFGKTWMDLTEKLVAQGRIKPHPRREGSGGLEGILEGLETLAEGVSGKKLVYHI
ncbi:putative zinc-binding oxidoreductase ToxD-1 [Coleophoma crateriformis]|uniref:Putative zinc-binding oxidoreductase ToxD-1 n=1 Tax=Coleophoma crateriformis TaxID=565419 RepID=A0A3D8Q8R1_9HELO|nr:putative zinc-binding oxidoreductase ToxD-1 [Coleophoma crateriformis]